MVGSTLLLLFYTSFASSFVFVAVDSLGLFCSLKSRLTRYLINNFIPNIPAMGTAQGMMVPSMRKAVKFEVVGCVDVEDDVSNDVTNNKLHH